VTDVTNASRTLLMNIATLDWDSEILGELEIPREVLPEIRSSSEVYSTGRELFDSVPIASALGDQQAALFGQACFDAGAVKNTYGTGCFMLMNTGTEIVPSRHGLLTTVGYRLANQPAIYCLEGSVAMAGALVQWLRDNLGLIESAAEIETLARTVEDNGGVYFVPAFSGLFAPYWRSDARGVIAGLTRFAGKGHIARAALEATAFQTREVLEAMNADWSAQAAEDAADSALRRGEASGPSLAAGTSALRADGGMVHNELLMQFQADILAVPVVRPEVAETTALGAAYAAGLAVGYWKDQGELSANWREARRWTPQMDEGERERLFREWKKAVTRTLDWVQ
jgi:glycerol kinase